MHHFLSNLSLSCISTHTTNHSWKKKKKSKPPPPPNIMIYWPPTTPLLQIPPSPAALQNNPFICSLLKCTLYRHNSFSTLGWNMMTQAMYWLINPNEQKTFQTSKTNWTWMFAWITRRLAHEAGGGKKAPKLKMHTAWSQLMKRTLNKCKRYKS